MGGSSSINGMLYVRGNKQDFDDWSNLGNPGWSWNEVLPYFKKSQNLRQVRKISLFLGYGGYDAFFNITYGSTER